jgi:hypothetical protein
MVMDLTQQRVDQAFIKARGGDADRQGGTRDSRRLGCVQAHRVFNLRVPKSE